MKLCRWTSWWAVGIGVLVMGGGLANPAQAETVPTDSSPANSPVLMLGDSMMRLPGRAMQRKLSRMPGIEARAFSGIGTGLARLDAFDWLGKIDELCAEFHPKVAVIALGANDRQPMQLSGTQVVRPGTPAWNAEYAGRIGQAMDRLKAGGCERIIWLLLPPMRDAVVDAFAQDVNQSIVAEAASRSGVAAHDFTHLVADRRTGGYTDRVMDPHTAAAIRVRDPDGIHLTPDGARLLATALIQEYWP